MLPPSPPGWLVSAASAVRSSGGAAAAAAAEPGLSVRPGREAAAAPCSARLQSQSVVSRGHRRPCGRDAGRRGTCWGAGGWGRRREGRARRPPPGAPLLYLTLCAPLFCTDLFYGGEVYFPEWNLKSQILDLGSGLDPYQLVRLWLNYLIPLSLSFSIYKMGIIMGL